MKDGGPLSRSAILVATLLLAGFAGGVAADRPPCDPAASVVGDPEVLPAVVEALRARGVRERSAPGCPLLQVHVAGQGRLLLVTITPSGPEARPSRRRVSNAATAAALIESFARSDLSDPLLGARTILVPAPPPARLSPPVRPTPRAALGVYGEAAVGTDGHAWVGGALRGCARLGRLCLGGIVRAAGGAPTALVGNQAFDRVAVDILFAGAVPIPLGRVSLVPGVGVGGGLLHVRASGGGNALDGGVRGELSLLVGVPLGAGAGLDAGIVLGVGYPPGGGGAVLVVPPDSRGSGDDDPYPVPTPTAPWGLLRGAVGLRWSGP